MTRGGAPVQRGSGVVRRMVRVRENGPEGILTTSNRGGQNSHRATTNEAVLNMKRIEYTALVALAALAFAAAACGQPLTTAEETQTAEAVASPSNSDTTTSPSQTSTPTTQSDEMTLTANVWVDAQRAIVHVQAMIGETECAAAESRTAPDVYESIVSLHIVSAAIKPGCGTPGALVRFVLGGRPATRTIDWQPGRQIGVDIVAGPEFQRVGGTYLVTGADEHATIEATVNGQPCSLDLITAGASLVGDQPVFDLLVFPEEVRPGCGRAGAEVALEAVDSAGAVRTVRALSQSTFSWEPGSRLNLGVVSFSAVGTASPTAAGSPPP